MIACEIPFRFTKKTGFCFGKPWKYFSSILFRHMKVFQLFLCSKLLRIFNDQIDSDSNFEFADSKDFLFLMNDLNEKCVCYILNRFIDSFLLMFLWACEVFEQLLPYLLLAHTPKKSYVNFLGQKLLKGPWRVNSPSKYFSMNPRSTLSRIFQTHFILLWGFLFMRAGMTSMIQNPFFPVEA